MRFADLQMECYLTSWSDVTLRKWASRLSKPCQLEPHLSGAVEAPARYVGSAGWLERNTVQDLAAACNQAGMHQCFAGHTVQ